jgi:hypothetical protein
VLRSGKEVDAWVLDILVAKIVVKLVVKLRTRLLKLVS